MHHARTHKTQVDVFLGLVERDRSNGVVGVALGNVVVVHVRVGDHGFYNLIQINHQLSKVVCIAVRCQRWFLTAANLADTLVSDINQTLQSLGCVVHAFVYHDLDAPFGNFQRLDQRVIFRDTDGRLGFHLCRPVGESERLVRQQSTDMHFDYAPLEDVVAKLLQHLCLCGMHHIAEIHMVLQGAFESHFDGLGNRHGGLAGGQRQGNCA